MKDGWVFHCLETKHCLELKVSRKTKAERKAKLQLQKEQQIAKNREEYPHLLMEMLERASKLDFKIEVQDGIFVVTHCDGASNQWSLTYEYTQESDGELTHLCISLALKEEKKANDTRKMLAKQAAPVKLTEEERVLLGLQSTSRY